MPLPSYIESDSRASDIVQHVHRLKRITPGASALNSFAFLRTENSYSKMKNKKRYLQRNNFHAILERDVVQHLHPSNNENSIPASESFFANASGVIEG